MIWIFIIWQKFSNNIKKLLDTGLDALKYASKKLVHKAAGRTVKFLANNTAKKAVKLTHVTDKSPRNVEEIIIDQEKKRGKI